MRAFALMMAALVCSAVQAAAPMAKTQPGFYRMMLGDFEVTALNDGVVAYDTAMLLPEAKAEQIATGLQAAGLTDPVGMSYNGFLINTGDKLVLIDAGTGGKLPDEPLFRGTGRLLSNLQAAGYRPEQIDEVYITHRGQDHIGGLTTGTKRTFPNAILRAPRGEMDILLDPEKSAAAFGKLVNSKPVTDLLNFTRNLFTPYIKAGKYQPIEADSPLVPGIRSLATPGHTPGHTSYIVQSSGQTLIVMGDLILNDLQIGEPSLASRFDSDGKAAIAQRTRVLDMAADSPAWIAGGHLAFPGIIRVRRVQGGYAPIHPNYTIP